MAMWRQAVLYLLVADTVQLVGTFGPLVLGALLGASLGSFRRSYGARWQCGLMAGLWAGGQLALIREWDVIPVFPFRRVDEILVPAGLLAALTALITSLGTAIWFSRTHSDWVRYFCAHPWRWTRSRFLRVTTCVILALSPAIWLFAQTQKVLAYEEILMTQRRIQPVIDRWGEYHIGVWPRRGTPEDGLHLTITTPRGLSAEALKLLTDGPWPYRGLAIQNAQDIRDEHLIAATPRLTSIQNVSLYGCSLTNDCLPALAECPQLRELIIQECSSMTAAGVQQFQILRPDVMVLLILKNRVQQFPAK